MVVLGIDPGTATMGWGIVDSIDGQLRLVAVGALTTPAGMPQPERLRILYDGLRELIARHTPESAAIEELFFGKNVNTAITVGQARGVALLALHQAGLPIAEYKPTVVKQAVVGYGGADKKQPTPSPSRSATPTPRPPYAAWPRSKGHALQASPRRSC